ncbi:TIGR02757 family protein [Hydrogenimonas sp.]
MRERLEAEARRRDDPAELDPSRPDPLMVARRQEDERAVLLCALFGYGNAGRIVDFLESLDFSLLGASRRELRSALAGRYYRFQSEEDVVQAFETLGRFEPGELETLFMEGYAKERRVLAGVARLLEALWDRSGGYESRGYRFLLGSVPKGPYPASAYKRWMMFLRWMVRRDALDLGRWRGVRRSDLVIPLDTHTFAVGRRLGLLGRRSCDWKAVLELTEALKAYDPDDPVRFDFALYRIGQENLHL